MKNFKLFGLVLLAVTLIFSSCSKDEDETIAAPGITFSNGNTELTFDGVNSVDVNVDVKAEGKVSTFTLMKIVKDANGSTETPLTADYDFDGETSGTFRFQRSNTEIGTDIILSTDSPKKVEYKFTVTDKEGVVKTAIYTVTMAAAATTPLATEETGMFYHVKGLLKGAYDLDADAGVPESGDASTKSMINTDDTGEAFTAKWISGNGTEYVLANGFDYTNATVESATGAFTAGTTLTTVTPAVNNIYIAKKGTTYYVVKITEIDASFSTDTGTHTGRITFTYKKN